MNGVSSMHRFLAVRSAALAVLMAVGAFSGCSAAKAPIPAAQSDSPLAQTSGKATAVFAGGCFWGTQSVFERVKGVLDTTAGYAGGSAATATYDQVTQETTGHAESVKVVYDPSKITYGQLYRFSFLSPTTRRSSIGRAPMSAHPTVRPSSTPTTSRRRSARHTSRNWMPRRSFPSPSSLRLCRLRAFTMQSPTTRITRSTTQTTHHHGVRPSEDRSPEAGVPAAVQGLSR